MLVCRAVPPCFSLVTLEVLRDETRDALRKSVPEFQRAWVRFDPKATGFIGRGQLQAFLEDLPPALVDITVPVAADNSTVRDPPVARASGGSSRISTGEQQLHHTARGYARRLLAQPKFVRAVPFTETLIALCSMCLARSSYEEAKPLKLAVPAGFMPTVVECTLANAVLRRFVHAWRARHPRCPGLVETANDKPDTLDSPVALPRAAQNVA